MSRVLRWVAVVAAILLTVAGCTGVPGASAPQVVRTVGLGEAPQPSAPVPPVGASPRDIVQGFLDAMQTSLDRLDSARAYLDGDAAQSWQSNPVFVIDNQYQVSNPTRTNTVQVTYRVIGTLAPNGVYSPQIFDGNGVAAAQPTTYSLAKNPSGQWRIHTPVPQGLLVLKSTFDRLFNAKPLYFLDTAGTRLVPDLRYSSLVAEASLETFLLTQLAAGPRDDLTQSVSRFAPTSTGNQRLSVTPGNPTVVQIPGAAALDGAARTRLAAQVAFTLRPTAAFQSDLQIRDSGQVVDIPGVGGAFDDSSFSSFAPVDVTQGVTATYVRGGAVVAADGAPLPGKLGSGDYGLDNAVFDGDGGRTLVAGTTSPTGDPSRRKLLVGDVAALHDVSVPVGPLTAPVWAPVGTRADTDEVWVASGALIYRFVPGVLGARPVPVQVIGANTVSGTITSMSFSTEGARLAMVIRSADGATSQVWLASVVRNGQDVRLTALGRVTPSGYRISDVGWRTETQLAAVGTAPDFSAGLYLEVNVDGARLVPATPDGLPGAPQSIATSPRSDVQWVTVGSGPPSVWTRSRTSRTWSSPTAGGTQDGAAPSFSV